MDTPTEAEPELEAECIAYRPREAARILGISRARLDDLIRAGHIRARKPSVQIVLVPRTELERYLASLPDAREDPDLGAQPAVR